MYSLTVLLTILSLGCPVGAVETLSNSANYNNLLLISFKNVLFLPAIGFAFFLLVVIYLIIWEAFFYVDMGEENRTEHGLLSGKTTDLAVTTTDVEAPYIPKIRHNRGSPVGSGSRSKGHLSEVSGGSRGQISEVNAGSPDNGQVTSDIVPPLDSQPRSPTQRASARMSSRTENRSSMDAVYTTPNSADVVDGAAVVGSNPMARRQPTKMSDDVYITDATGLHKTTTAVMITPGNSTEIADDIAGDDISSLSDYNSDSSESSSALLDELERAHSIALHDSSAMPVGTHSGGKKEVNPESIFQKERRLSKELQSPEQISPNRTVETLTKAQAVKSRPNMSAGFTNNVSLSAGKHRAVVKRPIQKGDFIEDAPRDPMTPPDTAVNVQLGSSSSENMMLINSLLSHSAEERIRSEMVRVQQERLMNAVLPLAVGEDESPPSPIAPISIEDPSLSPARASDSPIAQANTAAARARPSMMAGFKGNIALSGSRRSVIRRAETSSPVNAPGNGDDDTLSEMGDVPAAIAAVSASANNTTNQGSISDSEESSDISLPKIEDHEVKGGTPQLERRRGPVSSREDTAPQAAADSTSDASGGNNSEGGAMPVLRVDTGEDVTLKPTTAPTTTDNLAAPEVAQSSPTSWRRASINTGSKPASPSGENNWRRASIASPSFSGSFESVNPSRPAPSSPAPSNPSPNSPSSWRRASLTGAGGVSSHSIGTIDEKSELKSFVASPLSRANSRALSPSPGGSPPPIPARRPSRRPTAVPDALKQAAVSVAVREGDSRDSGVVESVAVSPAVETAAENILEASGCDTPIYSSADLKAGVPPGVDPREKEKYLSDEEFNTVFRMSKDAFSALPKWKQTTLKKDNLLY